MILHHNTLGKCCIIVCQADFIEYALFAVKDQMTDSSWAVLGIKVLGELSKISLTTELILLAQIQEPFLITEATLDCKVLRRLLSICFKRTRVMPIIKPRKGALTITNVELYPWLIQIPQTKNLSDCPRCKSWDSHRPHTLVLDDISMDSFYP